MCWLRSLTRIFLTLALGLWLAQPCQAAIAKVVSTYQGSADGNPFTTSAVDTTGSSCYVVVAVAGGPGTLTLSDSPGNTYGTPDYTGVSGAFQWKAWILYGPTTNASHTWTTSGSAYGPGLLILALSATATSAGTDQENQAVGVAASSLQPGSVTPGQDNEAVVTWVTGSDASATIGTDWSGTTVDGNLSVNSTHAGGNIAFNIQTTATARNPTWTWGFAGTREAAIVTIKSPAASTTSSLLLLGVGK